MQKITYADREAWLDGRRGRVTGTRLKDLIVKRGTSKKKGFYEIIAERIAIPRPDNENKMDRGQTLEGEAIERFVNETGTPVDASLVIFARDDDENIAYSPDGFITHDGVVDEDAEVKCLNSASHIEAYLTKTIPKEYEEQNLQAFCVNDNLKKRHWIFYDPSMPIDYFVIEVKREDVAEKVAEYLQLQRDELAEIERITNELLNF